MGKLDNSSDSMTNYNLIGVSVWCNDINGSINSTGVITPDTFNPIDGYHETDTRITFEIPVEIPYPDWGYLIQIKSPGYKDIEFRIDPKIEGNSFDVTLEPVFKPLNRAEICSAQVTLSGLMIHTDQFGDRPWFELVYQCLNNPSDRKSVRDQKKAAGDLGVIIEFFNDQRYIYPNRSGNVTWLGDCITQVGEFNQELFKDFVLEILDDGMVPVIVYDGDNGENPVDGYPNALRQLPILAELFKDYNDQILYARFWDGVFYGTTPEQIKTFGVQFRQLIPNGHLAIEFNPGHIPVGNGPSDYELPNGLMVDYDVVVGEFEYPDYKQDSTWQVIARLIPNYNRPSDQPSWDDPNPPFYLRTGNSRGKYYFWAMECGEYQWVRYEVSQQELVNVGNYFRNMNATNVGLPR